MHHFVAGGCGASRRDGGAAQASGVGWGGAGAVVEEGDGEGEARRWVRQSQQRERAIHVESERRQALVNQISVLTDRKAMLSIGQLPAQPYEALSTLLQPDEVHRNRYDPRMTIFIGRSI